MKKLIFTALLLAVGSLSFAENLKEKVCIVREEFSDASKDWIKKHAEYLRQQGDEGIGRLENIAELKTTMAAKVPTISGLISFYLFILHISLSTILLAQPFPREMPLHIHPITQETSQIHNPRHPKSSTVAPVLTQHTSKQNA